MPCVRGPANCEERSMSIVSLIAPQDAIIEKIVSFLGTPGRDYSDNIVVFPGKRPAHALRKALSKTTGGGFLPPKIFSIDNFVDHLFSEKLNNPAATMNSLDAAALLYEIHVADARRIGGNNFTSLDSFLPLGIKIYGELEEVWIADVPLTRVREALSGITYSGVTSLLVFYEQFYALARERNLATRSMKYRTAAEKVASIDFAEYSKIIFAGFFDLTKSEQTIVKHLNTLDNTVLIFQNGPGIGRQLKEIGVSPEIPPQETARPLLHFYRSADVHGQVFALTEKINEVHQHDRSGLDRTAIVLPSSETLFPVFHQTLSLVPDDGYNISLGYPVTRTPVYGFLDMLMELIVSKFEGQYSVVEYMKFVLHPYTKNIRCEKRSDVTRILVNTIEEYFLKEHSAEYFSLEELESTSALFDRAAKRIAGVGETVPADFLKKHLVSINASTIRVFDGVENIGDFAFKMIGVLRYINARSTAQLHPFFRPFAETMVEHLEAVPASLLSGRSFKEFVDYVSFFRNYIGAAEVPFTGTPLHGLQVLGFLETRNLQFDKVFILDANDDVLPGNKGHDVLLPLKLRESLGLSTFRDKERRDEYYFNCLLQGAKDVHLFFIQDGKKEKSRYVEKLLWEQERKEKSIQENERLATVQYRIQLANTTPPAIPKTEWAIASLKDFLYHATALDTYLQCQLKFYYAYVLKLQEREEVSAELEQTDIGSFIHLVLAECFRAFKGKKLEKKELTLDLLETTIDTLFAKEYGDNLLGPIFLLKRHIKLHLKELLTDYQFPLLEQGITLLDLELKLEATIGGYQCKGKLDRVERRGEKVYVLDYKTGSSEKYTRINFKNLSLENRDSWSDSIGSLQLPLYGLLYSAATGIRTDEIVPAYLFLGRQKIDKDIEEPLFGESNSSMGTFAMLEKIIIGLMDEITNIDSPFEPTKHFERDCRTCAFKYICGTQWVG
jgi:ATP-dependent helicase/nuclease subunit B